MNLSQLAEALGISRDVFNDNMAAHTALAAFADEQGVRLPDLKTARETATDQRAARASQAANQANQKLAESEAARAHLRDQLAAAHARIRVLEAQINLRRAGVGL